MRSEPERSTFADRDPARAGFVQDYTHLRRPSRVDAQAAFASITTTWGLFPLVLQVFAGGLDLAAEVDRVPQQLYADLSGAGAMHVDRTETEDAP